MSDQINSILFESALKIIRPLIRVMLRNGVSNGSFEELVRKAYVDEAFSLGKKTPGKTTISSVSAQTGLSRKEVKRLVELDNTHHTEIEKKYNRAVRVISGWVNDKRFTDSEGSGKALPMEGEISFSTLVKEYSGDIPTKAMLDLLLAADCVALQKTPTENEANNKMVELVKHAYVPSKDSSEIIRILGTDTNELINTIDYNLTADGNNKRYQRKVSSAMLDKDAVEEFKTLSNKSSQALLEDLDTWISKHEINQNNENTKNARYVSLGIYYYEEDNEE